MLNGGYVSFDSKKVMLMSLLFVGGCAEKMNSCVRCSARVPKWVPRSKHELCPVFSDHFHLKVTTPLGLLFLVRV